MRARHAIQRRLQQATGYVKFKAKSIKDACPMINAYTWAQDRQGRGGEETQWVRGVVGFYKTSLAHSAFCLLGNCLHGPYCIFLKEVI